MNKTLRRLLLSVFMLVTMAIGQKASASHFYGSDFYYTWVSGNTYTITLAVYGDCSGSSFPALQGATPEVQIYNGTTLISTINLTQQGVGVEVTPVCPTQQGQTVCSVPGSTIPGVTRYIYSGNYTLSGTSTAWKFRFTGNMGATSTAGRSGTITNIQTPGSSITALEAQLNNVPGNNSSPTYTTIPTPFFCINKPANYNPGAVDPNPTDALTFSLVAGLTPTGTVTYVPGLSATNPLLVAAGTFSFSSTSGQLSFTPNTGQRALIVSQVAEYRSGVLVGTSMREMTFVVLTTCNNNPPTGTISNTTTGATAVTPITVNACRSIGTIGFSINPTDPDGDTIDVVAAGIPTGATFTITNNSTTAPLGSFSWNITNVTPGAYNFFITYTDRGCPLSSKQTLAYTINVLPNPKVTFALVSPATCTKKAVFTLTPYFATAPYTISGGSTTFSGVTGTVTDSLSPGTYTFHIANTNGCTFDTSITFASPVLPVLTATPVAPTCHNGTNGSVTLSASGGVAPYQFSINGSAYSATTVYGGLSAGTYTVAVKDAGSCTQTASVTVNNTADILAQVTFTKPPCNHFPNGSLTVNAYNSVAPYQYALGSGSYQATGNFTGLYSGNYTVHIKNALNCIKDTLIVLPDSVRITATSIPITNATCFGTATGAVTINATGAYGPPYTYAINGGVFGVSNTFTNLTAGTYTLHVVDTEQCYLDTLITITQPTIVVPTGTVVQNVTCNGGSDGSISIAGSGGTPGYTYRVDNGVYVAGTVFTGLTAGSHTIYVKDANGCIQTTTISLTQPPAVVISASIVQPQCSYSLDGTITISATGGNGPVFSYSIDGLPYQASGTFTGMGGGAHVLHAKDNLGCQKDSNFTLAAPTAIAVVASVKKSTCATLGDGRVTLTGSGGTPGYTYANGAGTYGVSNIFTPLIAGTYTFHIKDTHGCIKDTTITISDSLIIHGNVTITNAACNAQSSGAINVTGNGGQTPYTYALGAGVYGTGGTFGTLPAGGYTLHIKDNNGCILDTALNITQPTRIVPSVTLVNATCNGVANGSITISATGGTPGYTFANGAGSYQYSGIFSAIGAGTYTMHTKDTNGCVIDTTITITQPTPLAFTLAVTNVLCNGGSTGAVTVTASGGTPSYTYASDAGGFSASNVLTGFAVGSHTIHLKDANGCTKDSTLNITQPAVLKMGYTATQPSCNAGNNGTIVITATGGTTAYQYAVNAGAFQASGTFTTISAGNYVLHLKDANGCTVDSNITIGEPTAVTVSVLIKRPRCTPLVNGAVTVFGAGGTPGYTYANGSGAYQASGLFNGLPSGTYTFHVKDTKGCIKDTTLSVSDSVFVHAQVAITNATCYDSFSGQVAITPSGGDVPYKYRLQPNAFAATNPIINVHAGNYTLSIKDSNGCVLDTAIVVGQPTVVVPNVVITQPACFGFSNGSIQLGATGGTPGYTYAISNGAYGSSVLFGGLPAGIDTLHVKDINGCRHDTIVTVAQPTPLVYANIALSNVKCYGDNSGYVTITGSGATPPYAYASDATAFITSNVLTGLNVGAHIIHLKDANGCLKDSVISLTQPPLLVLDSLILQTPTCEGYADGVIRIFGRGGTKPYQFSNDGVTYTSQQIYPGLVEGPYQFWVKDSQNCVHDTTVTLVGYPHIVINSAVVTPPSCFGFHNGSIQLNVTGGNPTLTYQLLKPTKFNGNGTFDSLVAGTYQLIIKDSTSCHKDTTVTMGQPALLEVSTAVTPNDCAGADDGGGAKTTVTGGTAPYSYLWNTDPAQTTPDLVGTMNGTYMVIVTDNNDCKDSSIAKVTYDDCCKPYMPDAFTPNGDNKNDVFRLRFKGDVSKLQLSVYNRFGERVWYTENINAGWDGTFHGVPADMGVYMYYIKFYCGNKEDNLVEYKGDVTLIR